ncbi:antigen WC1.1-like [Apteryx mantelli]|uniref:Antigen WC1.1-like n=1 Tax=Apteryx mantelli TaxID=2696672 RepID=A0ABM4FIR7_9AVES
MHHAKAAVTSESRSKPGAFYGPISPGSNGHQWDHGDPSGKGVSSQKAVRQGSKGLKSIDPVLLWVGEGCCGGEAGGGRCAGRVEVKHQGQWGTVCDIGWDMKDTAVVCKQLGCGSALEAPQDGRFGPGSGQIWLSGLECQGTETALSECEHDDWSKDYCTHGLDAGVVCSGFVQLVGGDSPCSGCVEIRDGDQWRTVCDSHFGLEAADVICRELQCGTVLSIPGAAHFGEGVGAIWDEELQCVGNESLLSSCPRMVQAGEWQQVFGAGGDPGAGDLGNPL